MLIGTLDGNIDGGTGWLVPSMWRMTAVSTLRSSNETGSARFYFVGACVAAMSRTTMPSRS